MRMFAAICAPNHRDPCPGSRPRHTAPVSSPTPAASSLTAPRTSSSHLAFTFFVERIFFFSEGDLHLARQPLMCHQPSLTLASKPSSTRCLGTRHSRAFQRTSGMSCNSRIRSVLACVRAALQRLQHHHVTASHRPRHRRSGTDPRTNPLNRPVDIKQRFRRCFESASKNRYMRGIGG